MMLIHKMVEVLEKQLEIYEPLGIRVQNLSTALYSKNEKFSSWCTKNSKGNELMSNLLLDYIEQVVMELKDAN